MAPHTITDTVDLQGYEPCGCQLMIAAAEGHHCSTGPIPVYEAEVTFMDEHRRNHIHTVRGPDPVESKKQAGEWALLQLSKPFVRSVAVREVPGV